MLNRALDRIDALREQPFHPFVEEQPGAVRELVHHPRRQIIRQLAFALDPYRQGPHASPHTMMHGESTAVYGFPNAVMTRSPRPSAGPRFTNSTWSSLCWITAARSARHRPRSLAVNPHSKIYYFK